MGLFNWPLQISNLNGDRSSEIEAMVDTGAIFTMLPGSLLREIGISPTARTYSNWPTAPAPKWK